MEQKSFWKLILFSFLTCGIYGIVFWYKFNEDTNRIISTSCKKTPNYFLMLLLTFVTCGIYYFVWIYKLGENLQDTGRHEYGLDIKYGGMIIVLWALLSSFSAGIGFLIAVYMLIENYNKVAEKYNEAHGITV